ncbi:YibE/F family protein [Actinocorallia sp. A-T 12471]|uniref:YibE/F family protein n=1 Tax=Actinocorallia sp. A-T 12471 TaxID=3089813 RepID=UPI0029D0A32E|nr:YibE/F family protein [Actinocorallia sp. A-T 12471]MDX6740363.1 YibE/F family protein [Actinocorallia sp. A-T 12471]
MGAGHHHGPAGSEPHGSVRWALALIVPLALATLAGLVWLWPSDSPSDAPSTGTLSRHKATVVEVVLGACAKPADAPIDLGGEPVVEAEPVDPRRCGTATLQLTSGPQDGQYASVNLPTGPGSHVYEAGDDVLVIETPGVEGVDRFQLSDHDRSDALWTVAAAFVLAVVAFGRWRGLAALAGLAITFTLLVLFLIPAILAGSPPLLVAIVCAAAVILAVLYLTHGFSPTTTLAVLGTLAALALTGILATAAIGLAHLNGITDESSFYLDYNYAINTQGLLLASIIIGSLGVLDDVTVTQAATVRELAAANPSYGFGDLYRAGARVGRAHIASVINTIVLAYAGASLPLLLLFRIGEQSVGEVLTNPVVAQEIVRSAAGTLGLIAAVPLTTALAAFTASRNRGIATALPTRTPERI